MKTAHKVTPRAEQLKHRKRTVNHVEYFKFSIACPIRVRAFVRVCARVFFLLRAVHVLADHRFWLFYQNTWAHRVRIFLFKRPENLAILFCGFILALLKSSDVTNRRIRFCRLCCCILKHFHLEFTIKSKRQSLLVKKKEADNENNGGGGGSSNGKNCAQIRWKRYHIQAKRMLWPFKNHGNGRETMKWAKDKMRAKKYAYGCDATEMKMGKQEASVVYAMSAPKTTIHRWCKKAKNEVKWICSTLYMIRLNSSTKWSTHNIWTKDKFPLVAANRLLWFRVVFLGIRRKNEQHRNAKRNIS